VISRGYCLRRCIKRNIYIMLCVWFLVLCGVCTSCWYPGSQPHSVNVGGGVMDALSGKLSLLEGERSAGHPPRGFLVTGSVPAGLQGSAGNTRIMTNVSVCTCIMTNVSVCACISVCPKGLWTLHNKTKLCFHETPHTCWGSKISFP
jgi:hypothetical protein